MAATTRVLITNLDALLGDPQVAEHFTRSATAVVAAVQIDDFTGALAGSITFDRVRSPGVFRMRIGSNHDHAAAVALGTGPQHIGVHGQPAPRPRYRPNFSKIVPWAAHVAISPSHAWNAIFTHGTKPQPYLIEALIKVFGAGNVTGWVGPVQ